MSIENIYKQQFQFTLQGSIVNIASMVMDPEDFEELVKDIEAAGIKNQHGVVETDLNVFRKMKMIPMVAIGTRTKHIFDKYQIDTPYMSATIRGIAKRLGLTQFAKEMLEEMSS